MSRTIAGAISILAIVLAGARSSFAISPGAAPVPGDIFVADQSAAGGTGSVIRVDPVNGEQKSVASGNLLIHPAGLTIGRDGTIFVAVPQRPGRIVKINPLTGAQESVSSGGMLVCPTGVASLPGSDLIVADPCAKKLIRIDHRSHAQRVLSSHGRLAFPQSVQ